MKASVGVADPDARVCRHCVKRVISAVGVPHHSDLIRIHVRQIGKIGDGVHDALDLTRGDADAVALEQKIGEIPIIWDGMQALMRLFCREVPQKQLGRKDNSTALNSSVDHAAVFIRSV